MPRNMAMESPHAGVRRIKLQHQVSTRPHNLHISSYGVPWAGDGLAIPVARARRQDVEVVSVEVHRVRPRAVVIHHDPDRFGVAKIPDVPHLGETQISPCNHVQSRVVVIYPGTDGVELEKEDIRRVSVGFDLHLLRHSRGFGDGNRVKRFPGVQVVACAAVPVRIPRVCPWPAGWLRVGVGLVVVNGC